MSNFTNHPTIDRNGLLYAHEGTVVDAQGGKHEIFRCDSYSHSTSATVRRLIVGADLRTRASSLSKAEVKERAGGGKFVSCVSCRDFWKD